MIKTTLIVALCGPITWIAWDEASSLVAAWNLRDAEIPNIADRSSILCSEADEILNSAQTIRAMLLDLNGPEQQRPSRELARAIFEDADMKRLAHRRVAERAKEIAERTRIGGLMSRLEPSGAPRSDRRQECDQLVRALDEYRNIPSHDDLLYKKARRLVDRIHREMESSQGRP